MENKYRPERALLHPLWWAALALLLLNDQVLKGSAAAPAWLTGKLSDLAGYLLLPALLAVLGRVRGLRGLLLCHGLALGLLAALELSPGVCAALGRWFNWRLWPDPTDLLAAVSVLLSWRVFLPVMAAPVVVAPRLLRLAVGAGCVACAATSQVPPSSRPAELFLVNDLGREVQVRVSALREEVVAACAVLDEAPEVALAPERFQAVAHVTLAVGDLYILDDVPLPARPQEPPCPTRLLLLSVEGQADRLLRWTPGALPQVELKFSETPATGGIRVREGRLDAEGALASVLRAGPLSEVPAAPPGCALANEERLPAWSPGVPYGAWTLRDVQRGADGCDRLLLRAQSGIETGFTVCAEPLGVPFAAGDALEVRPPADGSTGMLIERAGPGATQLALLRGGVGEVEPSACPAQRRSCGAARALRAVVNTPAGPSQPLAQGERQTLQGVGVEVEVAMAQAEERLVADGRCEGAATLGNEVTYLWIRKEVR